MIARRRTSHLRNSILYTSLFTIVGIMAIFLPISYSLASNLVQANALSYTERLLSQIKSSVQFYTDEMIVVSDFLSSNERVAEYMRGTSPFSAEPIDLNAQSQVAADLKAIAGTRSDLVNIILLRNDGSFVTNRDHVGLTPYWNYRDSDWYHKTIDAMGKPVMSASRVENVIAGEHRWVVSLSRGIYEQGQLLGVLLIDLNFKTISDICSSMSKTADGYIFIVGADDQLVYHPQQRLIYSGIKTERLDLVRHTENVQSIISEGTIYSSTMIKSANWVIVSVFDTNKLITISPTMVIAYVSIGSVFALIALIISMRSSKRLTDPILSLKNSMQQFQQGDFDAKANIEVNNEIADLGDQFNTMTDRIKNLVENGMLIEEQKRKSEIQALQSQIRPHFLYNTLESIIWMASVGEQTKVIEMTSALAKLMRASASDANELVTVQTEIDYVTNYLRIQKMRYQDKLQYRIEVEPETQSAKILRLTLQPLVENAIYHGIKPLRGKGLVVIAVKSDQQSLLIQIADNGVGFTPEAAERLMDQTPRTDDNIGLSNVHDRIRLFFGTDFGVSVQSAQPGQVLPEFPEADGIQTIVSIRLPLFFD